MKLNGNDVLRKYGLRQWNVEMGYSSLTNKSSWEAGSISPLILDSTMGLKTIKLTVLAKGGCRGSLWERCQAFATELLTPCELDLDGFHHHFRVVAKKATQKEDSRLFHTMTLELAGYEYGDTVWLEGTETNYGLSEKVSPAVIFKGENATGRMCAMCFRFVSYSGYFASERITPIHVTNVNDTSTKMLTYTPEPDTSYYDYSGATTVSDYNQHLAYDALDGSLEITGAGSLRLWNSPYMPAGEFELMVIEDWAIDTILETDYDEMYSYEVKMGYTPIYL